MPSVGSTLRQNTPRRDLYEIAAGSYVTSTARVPSVVRPMTVETTPEDFLVSNTAWRKRASPPAADQEEEEDEQE